MSEREVTDVEDVDEAIRDFNERARRVFDGVERAAMLHVNTVSGGEWNAVQNSSTWGHRDSAYHRLKSLRHHIRIVAMLRERANATMRKGELTEKLSNRDQRQEWARHWAEERCSMFDSLVFQVSSLFDYVGWFVFSIHGEKSKQQRDWNWQKVVRAARDRKNNPVGKTEAGHEIAKQNKRWAEGLYDYRSELIHDRSDSIGYTWNLNSLQVHAPQRFVREFEKLQELRPTLFYAAFWMLKEALQTVESIFSALNRELWEETKKTPVVKTGETYIRMIHPDLTEGDD